MCGGIDEGQFELRDQIRIQDVDACACIKEEFERALTINFDFNNALLRERNGGWALMGKGEVLRYRWKSEQNADAKYVVETMLDRHEKVFTPIGQIKYKLANLMENVSDKKVSS